MTNVECSYCDSTEEIVRCLKCRGMVCMNCQENGLCPECFTEDWYYDDDEDD